MIIQNNLRFSAETEGSVMSHQTYICDFVYVFLLQEF